MDLGTLYATLRVDTRGFEKARVVMARLESRTENISKKFRAQGKVIQQTSERMMRLGYYTSMYLTLPILAAGVATLAFQKRFGAVMFRVEHLLENSRAKTDKFRDSIIELAPKVGQGPFALSRSLEAVQQEGISAAQAMGVVKNAGKAAAMIGQRSMSWFARTIGNVAAALQVSGKAAASFVTQLAGREGMMLRNIKMSVGEVATQARIAGLSLKELGAMFDVVDDMGRHLYRSTTELKTAFQSLNMATDETSVRLRGVLKEQGLVAFLEELNKIAGKRKGIIAEIFPKSSLRILDDLRTRVDKLKESQEQWVSSTEYIDRRFNEFTNTVQYQFRSAIAALETTFARLGKVLKEKIIGSLKDLNEWLQRTITKIENLTQKQIDNILTIAKWVATFGPLLMVLGLLGSIVGNIMFLLGWVMRYISKLTFLVHPLGLALSGLVTGLILLHNAFADAEDKIKNWIDIVKKAATVLAKTFSGAVLYLAVKRLATLKMSLAATSGALGVFRGALVAAASAARTLGYILLYYLVIEVLLELKKQFTEVSKVIKETVGTWLKWFDYMLLRINPLIESIRLMGKLGLIEVKGLDSFAEYIETSAKAAKSAVPSYEELVKATQDLFAAMGLGHAGLEPITTENLFKFTQGIVGEQIKSLSQLVNELKEERRMTAMSAAEKKAYALATENNIDVNSKAYDTLLKYTRQLERAKKETDELTKMEGKYTIHIMNMAEWIKQRTEMIKDYTDEGLVDMTNNLVWMREQLGVLSSAGFEMERIMRNAFRGMQTSIEKALNNTKNIFQSFLQFFSNFIKGLIVKIMAAVAATFLLAAVLAAVGLPKAGPGKGVSTGFVGALDMAKKVMGSGDIFNLLFGGAVPKMHDGGSAPTDDYLALLRKDETVIPPEKLDESLLKPVIAGKVVFVQKYDELRGVLETGQVKDEAF